MRDFGLIICWHKGFPYKLAFKSVNRRILPKWFQHGIVHIWNGISCRIIGHYWFPELEERKGGIWQEGLVRWNCEICCDCGAKRSKIGSSRWS